jgi:hypothetical protein
MNSANLIDFFSRIFRPNIRIILMPLFMNADEKLECLNVKYWELILDFFGLTNLFGEKDRLIQRQTWTYVWDICHLSSDLNVVMIKTDALMRLWKWYPYWHNLSCLSLCISKSVDLCTDATSLFLICSASHTHSLSLSVSPLSSSLSPTLCFA